jgi:hypothetical protein
MVAALDKETAAQSYAENLTKEQCIELLTSVSIDTSEDEDIDVLREAVAVNISDDTLEPDDFEFNEDEARQTIEEDPLSVEVRSGWYSPGDTENAKPIEYNILLGTGGPATRIIGELDEHGYPENARLQVQDWGKPWSEYFDVDRDVLLKYAQCFYFGE